MKKIKEKNDFVKNLNEVYKDILAIKITVDDSHKTTMGKFYDVMRKWGICQGTWSKNGNGRILNNPEWNLCYAAFKEYRMNHFDFFMGLTEPPKDLLAYGEKPNSKKNDNKKQTTKKT
jgi:hypothetical protein